MALAALTGLAWGIAKLFERDDLVGGPLTVAAKPTEPAPSTAPLRDVDAIVTTPDRLSLVGRVVELVGVDVRQVTNTRALWVGTSPDRVLFIALDAPPGENTPDGERRGPQPGERVRVSGVLRAVPINLEPWRTGWGLDADAMSRLRRVQVYLAADWATLLPL